MLSSSKNGFKSHIGLRVLLYNLLRIFVINDTFQMKSSFSFEYTFSLMSSSYFKYWKSLITGEKKEMFIRKVLRNIYPSIFLSGSTRRILLHEARFCSCIFFYKKDIFAFKSFVYTVVIFFV